ncbi:hypothetical protein [Phreatobacter sp. AB_2022a]|uniref:hypothetical protein n=1 Tax=Phreatobacter sp. AB_2022a TaxID=3003134 RepID=UPI002286EF75|nr:hypothetical protein [Phreatobacter sp. AB_2022a]MCZ0736407.1 hypothetical protein [Phreatobacter sp. AB_2022a]
MVAIDLSSKRSSASANARPAAGFDRSVARRDLRFVSLDRRGGRPVPHQPQGGRVALGWVRAFLREGL